MAAGSLDLPVVDLASPDLQSAAEAVRKACVDSGFFYVTNHGIQDQLVAAVFAESKKFFELPLEEKMLLHRNSAHRGYTAPYDEKLDASSKFRGDLKESFYIGTVRDVDMQNDPNQWPPEGEVNESDNGNYGASAHSDYGMITLLATDGTPGLQICREKDKEDWKDVHHIEGALIVNIGDLLERWTNSVFRSTLHRVVSVGKERYSAAYFLDPNPDLVVQCLESCCCEAYPPRFPPIKAGDYLKERLSATYK
ncbi:2-oxoglutarate-Fe(II) type oxidoreductase hxnY-like isoform X2 [Lolium rigidum]|uniref:2-oxoglutarate-Fe(II) type oxidoreductase hxnY-like isoform X2 n=1 Tax=Lolium rigidum TaxID=89674 RepID=UPI001F5DAF56|nr:2-oxoglutarate-Fe(II) type oxidoreductase hxnY-like isoform X2 [Lolium rigidum]